MLTKKKIDTYMRFGRDPDEMARLGTIWQKRILNDDDWGMITGLLQDGYLVSKGLASREFAENLNKRLVENCENEEVVVRLISLSSQI